MNLNVPISKIGTPTHRAPSIYRAPSI